MPEPEPAPSAPHWHDASTALAFRPAGHGADCLIHRLAFRTLLGFAPTAADCAAYFGQHRALFERAAALKIARRRLAGSDRFHLNSRDIRRLQG